MPQFIQVMVTGLIEKQPYVAHEKGNWGPGQKGSDWEKHPMKLSADGLFFECDGSFLERGEEFKIVVRVKSAIEAIKIYEARVGHHAHVNYRFDYDRKNKTFWLLALYHPVIRPNEWDQNNLYHPS
jgi:hypothetical protein